MDDQGYDKVKTSGMAPDQIVAMLGLRPISGGAPDEKAALVFGKYKSIEEAEKGFKELEAKLGAQGTELGEMKKLVGQWQPWIEKAAPLVTWYNDTFTPNAAKFEAYLKGGGAPANSQPTAAAVDAAARTAAANTAGYEWLTPQEKAALQAELRQEILEKTLQPWTESFTKQAQTFANTIQQTMQNQHKSFTDVLWQTMARVVPKEKMDEVKAWHEASLRFADPSKIDPLKIGDEFVSLSTEKARLEARVKELEDAKTAADKAAVPSFFGSVSPDITAPNDTAAPASRDDRFKAVMTDVQTEHGPEGVRSMFPTLV